MLFKQHLEDTFVQNHLPTQMFSSQIVQNCRATHKLNAIEKLEDEAL